MRFIWNRKLHGKKLLVVIAHTSREHLQSLGVQVAPTLLSEILKTLMKLYFTTKEDFQLFRIPLRSEELRSLITALLFVASKTCRVKLPFVY